MTSPTSQFDVCAIGNVCIDLIATVDDAFLEAHKIKKSICTYINAAQLSQITAELQSPIVTPGGVGANVSHVIAALGGHAVFQGKGSSDDYSRTIRQDLEERGILTHIPVVASPSLKSSQVFCLGTPDGERSFASYDGSAKTLCAADLNLDYIRRSKITYLDAYTLLSADAEDAMVTAHQASYDAGNYCCFNPCDTSIIKHYPSALNAVLERCEMLICNLPEAVALFGEGSAKDHARQMADRFHAGAVTHGGNGAYVFNKGEIAFIQPADTGRLAGINSNGAGDHFAAGFLYGLIRGFPLEIAGTLGKNCALDCLGHPEARPLGSLTHLVTALTKI